MTDIGIIYISVCLTSLEQTKKDQKWKKEKETTEYQVEYHFKLFIK